jgi:hypothetical protein
MACGEGASSPADSEPDVSLVSPNGGEFAPTQAITWLARDADEGDVLSIDLTLLVLDGSGADVSSEVLATGLDNVVGLEPASFAWNRDSVPLVDDAGDAIPYKVRVTATDLAGNSTSDESDAAVTLLDGSALENLVWDDVQPILKRFCGRCHSEPAASPELEFFRLDKYDASDVEPPANEDSGVFEMRSSVYRRLLEQGDMPPFGNDQPGELDKMRIQSWLDDGAPLSLP